MSDHKDLLEKLNMCESETEKSFLIAAYGCVEGLIPQYQVLNYRIDFAIPEKMIAIEIDGYEDVITRDKQIEDCKRERCILLKLPNWRIIRFTNADISKNLADCALEILQLIHQSGPPYSDSEARFGMDIYDALDGHSKFLKKNPPHPSGLYRRSIELSMDGECDKGQLVLDNVIKINPQDTEAWRLKGLIFEAQGKDKDALLAYDESIEIFPPDADAEIWEDKCRILKKLGFKEEAEALEKAKAEEQKWWDPYFQYEV